MVENIQRRVIGHSLQFARNGQPSGIDFDALIQRLLLFDGYVIRTVRFKEIPFLVRGLGYEQTLEVLASGLIEIRCEVTQIGSERDVELKTWKQPTFSLVWIEAHDWEKYVGDCLADVQKNLALPEDKWQALEVRVRACIRRVDPSIRKEVGLSFLHSLDSSPGIVGESMRMAGRRRHIPIILPVFKTAIQRSNDFIQVESDLCRSRIPAKELWEIMRDGLMAVATLEQNIGEMKNYSALVGFSAEELPMFEERMSGLARLAYPEIERRAARIARLTGLPGFNPQQRRLDVGKLLQIRESDELRSFRDWLATSDSLSDNEVRQILRGFRARVSSFARVGSVTMTRWVVEQIAGLAHPILGAVVSALDTFLLERLFPHSGPAAFVNKKFPSLFGNER